MASKANGSQVFNSDRTLQMAFRDCLAWCKRVSENVQTPDDSASTLLDLSQEPELVQQAPKC